MRNHMKFIERLRGMINAGNLKDGPGCIEKADRIMRHEFNILGSGWIHNFYGMKTQGFAGKNYSDPSVTCREVRNSVPAWYKVRQERQVKLIDGYNKDYVPIDWHIDMKSGGRYDIVYARELKFGATPGVDAKMTSEFSKGFQLIALARAWRLTKDPCYRNEVLCQILDWMTVNPPEYGSGWRANMGTAIRVSNWITACAIIADGFDAENDDDRAFLDIVHESFLEHRRYITKFLEFTELPTSLHPNHYIANLSGLLILCSLMKEFDVESVSWEKMALRELGLTLEWQTNEDGMNFEGTTMYHAFVLEMIIYALTISARLNGRQEPEEIRDLMAERLGPDFLTRFHKMFAALRDLVMRDGRMPVIGDNDSGRFLPLENTGASDTYRLFLCGLGAALFDDMGLLPAAYKDSDSVCAYLMFDGLGSMKKEDRKYGPSTAFRDSGFYIIKTDDVYSFITCGLLGTEGRGTHAHNDRLSVLLYVKGEDIVIDPGVYAYTASMKLRDMYRNAEAHATVMINGKQPNRLNPPGCWWGYLDDTKCRCLKWEVSEDRVFFEGEHYGYSRLEIPVVHSRQVECIENTLRISDRFIKDEKSGNDMAVDYYFTLGPECRVAVDGRSVEIKANDVTVTARTKCGQWEKRDAWYAPEYGVSRKTTSLHIGFEKFINENEIIFTW